MFSVFRERERNKGVILFVRIILIYILYIYTAIKLKVKLDNDDTKTFRLIKECDLQLYEGVASSPNCTSQTEEESFE